MSNILINNKEVVIEISNNPIIKNNSNQYVSDGVIFADTTLSLVQDIEIVSDIQVQKYRYSKESGTFYLNSEYQAPIDNNTLISLQQQIATMQEAILALAGI